MSSHKSTKKQALFKVFIYGMIEIILFSFFIIISGLEGSFNWTVERMTSSVAGMAIQTVFLIAGIIGFVLVIQIIIFILLLFTDSDQEL